MKIESGSIAMTSQRSYMARGADLLSYSGWGSGAAISTLPTAKDSVQQTVTTKAEGFRFRSTNAMLTELAREQKTFGSKKSSSGQSVEAFVARDPLEFDTFRNILELLFGRREEKTDWLTQFRELVEKRREALYQSLGMTGGQMTQNSPTESWGMSYQEVHYFEEQESTSFYSSGKVKTEDGREINFDVSVYMSRSFRQYSSVQIDYEQAAAVDPLVINMGSDTASVREQKFLFDLDCDGTMDNISMLSEMSGYLAFDRNEDGTINDGSELFGTKSGDGFGELAVFDMDHNGWIDENDPIFNQLRIWTKDADGNDKLIGLGIAGVGAIYLGNIDTQYALNSAEDNRSNAQIRSTGIYLKENGGAGTIQHIDMTVAT